MKFSMTGQEKGDLKF